MKIALLGIWLGMMAVPLVAQKNVAKVKQVRGNCEAGNLCLQIVDFIETVYPNIAVRIERPGVTIPEAKTNQVGIVTFAGTKGTYYFSVTTLGSYPIKRQKIKLKPGKLVELILPRDPCPGGVCTYTSTGG